MRLRHGVRPQGLAARLRGAFRPGRGGKTTAVALGAAGSLIAGIVVAGIGTAGADPDLSDIGAWLANDTKSSLTHVNGLTGQVDGRVKLPAGGNTQLQVADDGKSVLVLDESTGTVSRIDPAQLTVPQTYDYQAAGLQIASGGGKAWVVDSANGTVTAIDPVSLAPLGAPMDLGGKPLGEVQADPSGTLWVPIASLGRLVPVNGSQVGAPIKVAEPGGALLLTLASGRPVVTDVTGGRVLVVSGTGIERTVELPTEMRNGQPDKVFSPGLSEGPLVPVLASDTGTLTLVDIDSGSVNAVPLTVAQHEYAPPQVLGARVYIPDRTSGNLLVYNTVQAMFEDQVKVTGKPGPLETHVRDGLLWVNDAQNATAAVVNVQGQIHLIDKYDTDPSPGTGNGSSVPTPAKSVPEGGVTQSTEAGTPSATVSEAPSGATGGKEDPVPNPVDTGKPAPEAPVIPPAIPDPPADNGNQGGNQGGNGSGGNSGRTEPEPDPEPTRRTEPTTEVPRPPVETPEPPTNPITPPWTPPAASTPPPADTPPPPATTPAPPNTTPPAATTPPANTTPPASTSSKPPTASTKPPTTSSKPTSSNPTSSKPPTTSPKPTTTAPMKPPGTPTAKSGAGKITLTFQPASGATPTRYRVGGVGAGMSVAPASVPATGPFMFTVTGGSCEKEYKFYIIAEYPGAVMNSKASTGVRPCVAAGKPTNLQAVTAAGGKAKVSWSAPTNTAGETVTYTGSWSVKAASTSTAKAAGPADGPLTVTPAVYGELIAEPPAVNFPTVADGTNAAAVAAAKSGSWTTTNKSVTLSVSGQSGSYTFKVSAKNSAGTTSSSTATLTITLAYGKVTSASIDMPPETPGSAPYPPTPSPGAPTNDERPDAVALAAVVAPNRRDVPVT